MATSGNSALERAGADLASGRLWKARDRLVPAVKGNPTDQRLLLLLGEVYFAMGDLPSAGRFWLPTERSGPPAEAALVAFEERWGGNLGEKLKMVPVPDPDADYPPVARERIRALQAEASGAGIEWPRGAAPEQGEEVDVEAGDLSARAWLAVAAVVILGPGLWILGIVASIYVIATWLV